MKVDFKWFGGGNWMIIANGIKIICDPVLCPVDTIHNYGFFKSKRITPPFFSEDDLKNVDIWLFTHGHKDHRDFWTYKPINKGSKVIADLSASVKLNKLGIDTVQILEWQDTTDLTFQNGMKIGIKAVPAVHGINALKGKLVGNGNGYLIDLIYNDKMYSIYTTGDTLPNQETVNAIQNKPFDLVIANVGNAVVGKGIMAIIIGRITMNISDLVSFKKYLKTKTIIPIHWDAFEHYIERDIVELCKLHNFSAINQGSTMQLHTEITD